MEGKTISILLAVALISVGSLVYFGLEKTTEYPIVITYYENTKTISENSQVTEAQDIKAEETPAEMPLEPEEEFTEGTPTFPLSINSASEEELEYIPGIGSVTAQRIVQYREFLGGYSCLEQLQEIKGIGEKTYSEIISYLIL